MREIEAFLYSFNEISCLIKRALRILSFLMIFFSRVTNIYMSCIPLLRDDYTLTCRNWGERTVVSSSCLGSSDWGRCGERRSASWFWKRICSIFKIKIFTSIIANGVEDFLSRDGVAQIDRNRRIRAARTGLQVAQQGVQLVDLLRTRWRRKRGWFAFHEFIFFFYSSFRRSTIYVSVWSSWIESRKRIFYLLLIHKLRGKSATIYENIYRTYQRSGW